MVHPSIYNPPTLLYNGRLPDEAQLKEALDELGSARMIIDILQKQLLTSTATKNTQDNNLAPTDGFINWIPGKEDKISQV
jgi:hypothetical protein